MNPNDREWKEFKIDSLFSVSGTTTTKPQDLEDSGGIPRITCSATNNGLDGFYNNKSTESGGVLTVDSATIGYISYQGHSFIATDHVEKIEDKEYISRERGLFLVAAFTNSCGTKYNYGYKFSQSRIKRQTVTLPVNKYGEPDFLFMEEYVKEKQEALKEKYLSYLKRQLTILGKKVNIPDLNSVAWKEFFITEIFQPPKRGKRIISQNYIDGDMPVVSSAGGNNGVIAFAGNTEKVRIYGECLSVANGGVSAGFAFYHPYDFIATDHVTHFKGSGLNKYHYLFIATIIKNQMHDKYDFSREMTDPRLKREKIILPINKDGSPDFSYMEQYSKNLLIKKYIQYLDYIG